MIKAIRLVYKNLTGRLQENKYVDYSCKKSFAAVKVQYSAESCESLRNAEFFFSGTHIWTSVIVSKSNHLLSPVTVTRDTL